jgi:hypothetical protein
LSLSLGGFELALSLCEVASFNEIRNFQSSYINKVMDLDLDLDLVLDRLFDRASPDNGRLVQIQVEVQVQDQVRTIW